MFTQVTKSSPLMNWLKKTLIYILKFAPEIVTKISHFIEKPQILIKKFILHGYLGITYLKNRGT